MEGPSIVYFPSHVKTPHLVFPGSGEGYRPGLRRGRSDRPCPPQGNSGPTDEPLDDRILIEDDG